MRPELLWTCLLVGGVACAAASDPLEELKVAIADGDEGAVAAALSEDLDLEPVCEPYRLCKPLRGATMLGHLEIVRLLVEAGADVNARGSYGDTPWISAGELVEEPEERETLRRAIRLYLFENGADPNLANEFGMSPFLGSVAEGDLEMAQAAVRFGAEVHRIQEPLIDPRGAAFRSGALHYAAQTGNAELCRWLLSLGVDPSYVNSAGESPADRLPEDADSQLRALLEAAADRRRSARVRELGEPSESRLVNLEVGFAGERPERWFDVPVNVFRDAQRERLPSDVSDMPDWSTAPLWVLSSSRDWKSPGAAMIRAVAKPLFGPRDPAEFLGEMASGLASLGGEMDDMGQVELSSRQGVLLWQRYPAQAGRPVTRSAVAVVDKGPYRFLLTFEAADDVFDRFRSDFRAFLGGVQLAE